MTILYLPVEVSSEVQSGCLMKERATRALRRCLIGKFLRIRMQGRSSGLLVSLSFTPLAMLRSTHLLARRSFSLSPRRLADPSVRSRYQADDSQLIEALQDKSEISGGTAGMAEAQKQANTGKRDTQPAEMENRVKGKSNGRVSDRSELSKRAGERPERGVGGGEGMGEGKQGYAGGSAPKEI